MTLYNIVIAKSAEKELAQLPVDAILRIRDRIRLLAANPRPDGCKKLRGYKDLYRIRIGDYRVIYSINDGILTITVVAIGDRKDIYG